MQESFFDNLAKAKKVFERCMEPVCEKWELTHSALDVLVFLAENPGKDRASDIVSFRALTKSHVSLSISQLEEKGLLLRLPDSQDRRTVHLVLMGSAQAVVSDAKAAAADFEAQIFEGVSQQELDSFQHLSQIVSRNIARMGSK